MKTGVLLVNLGTPDSPSVRDVRKYLQQFLMDRRVIDIPPVNRFLLINAIIAPLRAPKSAKVYKELWQEHGSPLLFWGKALCEKVQKSLGSSYVVVLGMRYQNPSLKEVLDFLKKQNIQKLVVLPLFPQYASASTGSAIEEVMRIIKKWEVIPTVKFISNFFAHPLFIKAFAEIGKAYMNSYDYEHYIFSYHGLPERQILKASVEDYCKLSECCNKYHTKNYYCYRAQCYETTRLLTKELNIPPDKYSVAFQSRLGKTPWIKPYADELIVQLAQKGIKSILFFSPSFISDCLETTIEGGIEYRDIFIKNGGHTWQLVESLNDNATWVDCVCQLVQEA
ncbi:MAG: ferrochelatase [Cytophagaceae bacterium]|nr:ferrochelatase [Cytophagaceae bacterium]MDW8455758.1 ferrochelatase [Cytophagaceae bacterium]